MLAGHGQGEAGQELEATVLFADLHQAGNRDGVKHPGETKGNHGHERIHNEISIELPRKAEKSGNQNLPKKADQLLQD